MTGDALITQETLNSDLLKSGIVPTDIDAYLAREPEIVACKIGMALSQGLTSPGYVIPYYGIDGKRQPFYRVRLFNPLPGGAKYLQPPETSTYVYFPKQFHMQLQALAEGKLPRAKLNGHAPYVIICEGEKKAAKAAKEGFLAIALGGVYNWKSRTITLPGSVKIERDENKDIIRLKLPNLTDEQGDQYGDGTSGKWAVGFGDIIGLVQKNGWNIVIIYDSDVPEKPQVQKAAASLAFELRAAGIPITNIRQLRLPTKEQKVALDDFLEEQGADVLTGLIHDTLNKRCAFPTFPNMREFVNAKLKYRLGRAELKELSSAILADMDVHGVRLRDINNSVPYYFDNHTRKLMRVSLMHNGDGPLHESAFGRYLYRRYDISPADTKLLPWLAAAFTGEDPVFDVQPHSVFTITKEGNVAFQINDGQYILVTGDPKQPLTLCNNGDRGILFRADQIEPLESKDIFNAFQKQQADGIKPWWFETANEFKFVRENDKKLAAILFYISPWLLRWKGTQLPVELMVGEPGSGKSSMYMLRMSILTGRPALRNQPSDVRDWYSSITQVDGLHVTDNVHFVTKDIRQRLSDEMAQPLDAQVLTPSGYRTMGELMVGDYVINPEGNKVRIIKEHPHGEKDVYRVVFSDSSSTECCMDHLWCVHTRDDIRSNGSVKSRVLPLKQIASEPLRYGGKHRRAKWYIPEISNKAIDLTMEDIDYSCHNIITPYVLGAFLGDGNLSSRQLFIADKEGQVVNRVLQELPMGADLGSSQEGNYYVRGNWQEMDNTFKALGLKGKLSRDKFIPREYLHTTASRRLALLQGLMDTDGTVRKAGSGTAMFSSTSKDLAYSVQFICQSLGGRSTVTQRLDGAYQVTVSSLPAENTPFSCDRKVSEYMQFRTKPHTGRRSIVDIQKVGKKEVKCISLETADGLYITNDFIVTHNCRLVTEPDPFVELRKLYTTSEVSRIPVRSVFALTAIQQPFTAADILQRAAIFDLEAVGGDHDSDWVGRHLRERGGRAGWVAHHLLAIHLFLKRTLHDKQWDYKYKSNHRLVNYEQALSIMGEIVGIGQAEQIKREYIRDTSEQVSEYDWTMEGLKEFGHGVMPMLQKDLGKAFTCQHIADWANGKDEFKDNLYLNNARRLSRYIKSHATMVEKATGIYQIEKKIANRDAYRVRLTNQI